MNLKKKKPKLTLASLNEWGGNVGLNQGAGKCHDMAVRGT